MVTAWVYDHKYMSDEFDYADLEKEYLDAQKKDVNTGESLKE